LKKILLATAIAASAISAPFATAAEGDWSKDLTKNWKERSYAQVKLGFGDAGLSDNAMLLTGVYGLEMHQIHPMLSLEADLSFTIVDAESSMNGTTTEASVTEFGGYLVGSYNGLSLKELIPFARVGLVYSSYEVTARNSYVSASGDDSSIGLGFTVGARYVLSDELSVLVDYTSTELDTFNAGVSYKF